MREDCFYELNWYDEYVVLKFIIRGYKINVKCDMLYN